MFLSQIFVDIPKKMNPLQRVIAKQFFNRPKMYSYFLITIVEKCTVLTYFEIFARTIKNLRYYVKQIKHIIVKKQRIDIDKCSRKSECTIVFSMNECIMIILHMMLTLRCKSIERL